MPLDEVLIKLRPEGFHQAFEADGINVGLGGISMRASMLPQVGSMLRCQLDNPPGGEAIQMIGRVVWAHESGEHAGKKYRDNVLAVIDLPDTEIGGNFG